ncbi:hypothetical protein H0E87_012767, partial [Populus deltoides]
ATSGELEKQESDSGAQEMSDPVKDATQEGDVATNRSSKSNAGLTWPPEMLAPNRHSNEKSESMGDSCSDKSSGCVGSTVRKFGRRPCRTLHRQRQK